MSTIFYSMCGEGLGHCARAMAVMEHMPQHDFYVFTYGDGFKYLQENPLPNMKQVFEINGMSFGMKNGSVDFINTIQSAIKLSHNGHKRNKKFMLELAGQLNPKMAIVDWEPSLPRAAKTLDIPVVSVDSQHKFRFDDMKGFPWWLKVYSFFAGLFCGIMVPNAKHHVLCTFQSDLIERKKGVTLAQCLIRKNIASIPKVLGDSLLVYVRQEEIARKMLDSILKSDTPVRPIICYGVRLDNEYPQVTFRDRSYMQFAYDLANCKAVFTTAGIQLVGEARYYGKPSFVVPIPGQYEQSVNGRYVDVLKLGTCVPMHKLTPQSVTDFLNTYNEGIPASENGVHDVIRVVEHYLQEGD